jgi:hypothetical protein
MVDQVLKARAGGVRARETLLVELLDMVLVAAAERLVELGASGEGEAETVGRRSTRDRRSPRLARDRSRRTLVH